MTGNRRAVGPFLGWILAAVLGFLALGQDSRHGDAQRRARAAVDAVQQVQRKRRELDEKLAQSEASRQSDEKKSAAEVELSERRLTAHRTRLAAALMTDPAHRREALELLDRVPERLRNWEWRHLRAKFDGPLFESHGHKPIHDSFRPFRCLAYGERIVWSGEESDLRFFDGRTGEMLRLEEKWGTSVLDLSPDGSRILIDNGVADSKTGKFLSCFNSADLESRFSFEWR